MNIWHYLFDNQNNYDYDDTVIEIANKSVKLKKLRTGLYDTNNPVIETNMVVYHQDLIKFNAEIVKTVSDEIKFILSKFNYWYYWDGANWVVSDETYAQSNTLAEISTNFTTFFDNTADNNTEMRVKIFLHSDTGATTPELKDIEIRYNFGNLLNYDDIHPYIQNLDLVRLSNDDESFNDFVYQASVNYAIERAEVEMIKYLRLRYKFPLATKSNLLKSLGLWLFEFFIYERKELPTKPTEQKFAYAIDQLKDLRDGKIALDVEVEWQDKELQIEPIIINELKVYPETMLETVC